MKNKLLIAIALSVAVLTSIGAQTKTREYKFVYQCDEKKVNSLAKEGWELTEMSMAAYGSMGVATCVLSK